ncbi:VOC family protein [Oscillibacter sp. MSJ-2]|uniref:VOC family protein n=2 Tax=Dysosmobacter acutus TaxID=2841504 RepID=A0ABS6FDX2_9FIRM|nr:VOC family protein [Dysosmobacter acutus]MBU5627836.1 VOC family protein [Dysosmobacter acutus]
MTYQCTLLAVEDLEKSKEFYCGLLGMTVTADFGANVTLSNRLTLQTMGTWREFLRGRDILTGHNAGELYFEEEEFDRFLLRLQPCPNYVHPPHEHAWGQRVVRIYDPDRNIVEVGEPLSAVARRFLDSGMCVGQVAERMDVPPDYVRRLIAPLPDRQAE